MAKFSASDLIIGALSSIDYRADITEIGRFRQQLFRLAAIAKRSLFDMTIVSEVATQRFLAHEPHAALDDELPRQRALEVANSLLKAVHILRFGRTVEDTLQEALAGLIGWYAITPSGDQMLERHLCEALQRLEPSRTESNLPHPTILAGAVLHGSWLCVPRDHRREFIVKVVMADVGLGAANDG